MFDAKSERRSLSMADADEAAKVARLVHRLQAVEAEQEAAAAEEDFAKAEALNATVSSIKLQLQDAERKRKTLRLEVCTSTRDASPVLLPAAALPRCCCCGSWTASKSRSSSASLRASPPLPMRCWRSRFVSSSWRCARMAARDDGVRVLLLFALLQSHHEDRDRALSQFSAESSRKSVLLADRLASEEEQLRIKEEHVAKDERLVQEEQQEVCTRARRRRVCMLRGDVIRVSSVLSWQVEKTIEGQTAEMTTQYTMLVQRQEQLQREVMELEAALAAKKKEEATASSMIREVRRDRV